MFAWRFLHKIIISEGRAVIPAEVFRVLGFFSSPGLLSVLEAETQMVTLQLLHRTKCLNRA